MWTIIVLLIEIAVFILLSILMKGIRSYRFYFFLLNKSKSQIKMSISIKEKIAYFITKIAKGIPSFSFAPSDYDYWVYENEKSNTTKREKVFYLATGLILLARSIIGNVLYDVIFAVSFVLLKGYVPVKKIGDFFKKLKFDKAFDTFTSKAIEGIDWIQNNVNLVLVLIIVVFSLYIGWLKRKKRRYSIEAVWAKEDAERVKKVAKIQKELEDSLLELRHEICSNMVAIREILLCLKEDDSLASEHIERLNDYSQTTDRIKKLLNKISKVEGIQIYAQRNKKMYLQLTILELRPSLSDKSAFINLDRVSKSYIASNCTNKRDLYKSYAYGVAFMNGINRFLSFSYKKRRQYNKIVMHITDVEYLKSIVSEAAE